MKDFGLTIDYRHFEADLFNCFTGLMVHLRDGFLRELDNEPYGMGGHIERFDKIYLWMDHDIPGQEGAEKFAGKLGPERCMIVRQASPRQMQELANDIAERTKERANAAVGGYKEEETVIVDGVEAEGKGEFDLDFGARHTRRNASKCSLRHLCKRCQAH